MPDNILRYVLVAIVFSAMMALWYYPKVKKMALTFFLSLIVSLSVMLLSVALFDSIVP